MKKQPILGFKYVSLIAALWAFLVVEDVQAYGLGAPTSTCLTRYPKHHGASTQTGVSPFKISVNTTEYEAGDVVEVTISGASKQFRGFELAAYREPIGGAECQPAEIVGRFHPLDDGKTKIFTCAAANWSFMNLATHKNNDLVSSVTFNWTAPPYNAGNILFQATVVEDFSIFWTNVNTTLTAVPGQLLESPQYAEACAASLSKPFQMSGCGDHKACFLYPRHCEEDECVAAASFEYRSSYDDYLVEMYANPGSPVGYVGVAFSEDADMANDETFTCAATTNEMSVQHGFNPGKFNERFVTNDLKDAEVQLADSRLGCRFVMPAISTVRRIDSATVFSDQPKTLTFPFDKNEGWRIQLAWGPVMADSNVITRHKDMPATSFSSVNIKDPQTHRGTAFHVLVRVHGALMIVAWTFLSGIVTVIARHYREMMSRKQLCGTKIWFQVHRGLAILVATLTALGLIIIFSHYGTPIRTAADPHAYWGLAATVAVGLQVIAGMLRPGPDHKLRIFFNWGHRILGHASHIIAGVTMFLAFNIDYITEDMNHFGTVTLSIWAGVQIMWHICFEVVSCILRRSEADSYQVGGDKNEKGSWIPAVFLTIYVVFLAACCVAVLCAFLFY